MANIEEEIAYFHVRLGQLRGEESISLEEIVILRQITRELNLAIARLGPSSQH